MIQATESPPFRLIAHRGASIRAPENTRAAFRSARDTASQEIETDLQLSTDGVVVLCHDQTLARYGHGTRSIETCSYAELAKLDFGSWFSPQFSGEHILSLDDYLTEFGDVFVHHIEFKGAHPLLAKATFDLVNKHDLWPRCIFTSFSYQQLLRARTLSSQARLGWLVKTIDDVVLQQSRSLSLFQICPKAEHLTRTAVQTALSVVPEVRAWGLPREKNRARQVVQQLQQIGCCGTTIDEPLWVQDTVASTPESFSSLNEKLRGEL